MIKINFADIAHATPGKQERVSLDMEHLIAGDLDLAYLRGTLHFTRVDHGILVEGKLETAVKTECSRCLTPFYEPVTIELADIIGLPGMSPTPERPVNVHEDGWADLTPLIREYAWLGLPLNPLCSPDCPGLCPVCGGNIRKGECTCGDDEPIDPRWEALRPLLNEAETSQGHEG